MQAISEAEALAIANPPPSLDERRAAKRRRIDAAYAESMSSILDAYPEAERLTWDKQEDEARAWIADDTTATPYLDGLAAARGIALAEVAARVIEKSDAFMAASSAATGKRQRLIEAIEAAPDAATLEEIRW
jgi:hypothetical protein